MIQKKTRKPEWLSEAVSYLASVRLTVLLLSLIIPATILGTLIPQQRPFEEYFDRYGWTLTRVIHRLWLDEVFKSAWFSALLAFLAVNITVCSALKLLEKKKSYTFIFVHVSLLFLIAGGMLSGAGRIRGDLRLKEGVITDSFTLNNQTEPLGFSIRLKRFQLEHYERTGERLILQTSASEKPSEYFFRPNIWTQVRGSGYEFRVEKFIPDFRMDEETREVFSASNEVRNPAIRVHVRGNGEDYSDWLFGLYPNVHSNPGKKVRMTYLWESSIPKSFVSDVEILQGQQVVRAQQVRVNAPLRFGKYSLYQSGYDPSDLTLSEFQVVSDPGTWVVYIGVLGLMAGLCFKIYIKPLLERKQGTHV